MNLMIKRAVKRFLGFIEKRAKLIAKIVSSGAKEFVVAYPTIT